MRGRKPISSYIRPSKSQHAHHGSKFADSRRLDIASWNNPNGSTLKLADSYIPLGEVGAARGQITQVSGGFKPDSQCERHVETDIEKFPGNGILKPVRMESIG